MIDCWSTSENLPSTDASQDYVVLGWSRNTTTTTVKFKRLMYTGDSYDTAIVSAPHIWSYAFRTSEFTMAHEHTEADTFNIDLSFGPQNPNNNPGI